MYGCAAPPPCPYSNTEYSAISTPPSGLPSLWFWVASLCTRPAYRCCSIPWVYTTDTFSNVRESKFFSCSLVLSLCRQLSGLRILSAWFSWRLLWSVHSLCGFTRRAGSTSHGTIRTTGSTNTWLGNYTKPPPSATKCSFWPLGLFVCIVAIDSQDFCNL